MKSLDARIKQTFLRDTFYAPGKYEIPIIGKDEIDFTNFNVIGFHNTKPNDIENIGKSVYFFIDDYKFTSVWNRPDNCIEKLRQYKQVFSPDFSLYTDMPIAIQIYNTFRRYWCSAYWQSKGIKVIPTVTWGDERSFKFCFEGILEGSIVAVSTLGTRETQTTFLTGYKKMCEVIKPEKLICFCNPYKEMYDYGIDIIHVEPDGRRKAKEKNE